MTIELTTRAAAHALATYLGNCGCRLEFIDECLLKVAPPARSQSACEAAIELEAYVRVWRLLHPLEVVKLVDDAGEPRST